ncbi:hypothetical protein PsorP6_007836 [Peronosclerospora sorghi]|uniref:Uncharacterized protein n=1 Tax=Peronosclerospora sorghi TaxID=230839 RepID=A0ACC0WCJ7_9STRA|nr:hypothetical protein PsorP6_007836 [Peronosclerospora sorghi]
MRDTMLHIVKKVTTVPKTTVCRAPSQLRLMGHGPAPAEGSLEAKVRKYLPKDYHIVMATLGAYASIFMFFKLKPPKKKEEVVICMWLLGGRYDAVTLTTLCFAFVASLCMIYVASGTSSSASTSISSLFDEEFNEWSKLPGNLEKWEKSLETLGN